MCITVRTQTVNAIIYRLMNFRSENLQRFKMPFGLPLLAHSTPHPVVNMLNKVHLSLCFNTISSTAVALASGYIAEVISIAKGPHVLANDNIQASTLPLVEQREGPSAKIRSGTVSVIYPNFNADPSDMSLPQIHKN